MMERLTAFEFVAATERLPQRVRLLGMDGTVLAEVMFVDWIGYVFPPGRELIFARRDDLIIEGQGLAHPYWHDEPTPWHLSFDSRAEAQRIEMIRAAVGRELNRAKISLVPP